jgi:membrane protease YdiL (CAAX protease family)
VWLRLGCAALVEIAYALATRVWLPTVYSGFVLELLITAARLISLLAFFLLFRQLIFSRAPDVRRAAHPLTLSGVVLLLATPVLIGRYDLPDVTMQMVFAATSIAVAFKEEFLYRGVLQNIVEPRLGLLKGVIVSNIVFTLYHYGAQPFTLWNVIEIFTAGCILGLLYSATGSLMLVIAIHAVNDAIWSFTPLVTTPLPRPLGSLLLISGAGLVLVWLLRSNTALEGKRQIMTRS